jgi:hypothetical protein
VENPGIRSCKPLLSFSLLSSFWSIGPSLVPIEVYRNIPVFLRWGVVKSSAQHPSWRTSPCLTVLQPPRPSATWGRAPLWWQLTHKETCFVIIHGHCTFQCILSTVDKFPDCNRIHFLPGLRLFFILFYPWPNVISDTFLSLRILRLSFMPSSLCSLNSTHFTVIQNVYHQHHRYAIL